MRVRLRPAPLRRRIARVPRRPSHRPLRMHLRRSRPPGRLRSRSTALLLAVGALGLVPGSGEAQTPGREPALLELGMGARALGLGMAPQIGGDDPDAVFVHPALALQAEGFRVGLARFGNTGTGYGVSAGTGWWGGAVAVSLQTLDYNAPGPGLRPGGMDPFFGESGTGVAEAAATLTYARELFGVDVGVSGRMTTQRFDGASVTTGMADVGASLPLGPVRAALSVRNLGRDPELGDEALELPMEVVLGVGGYGRQVGPLDLGLAAQVARRDDGEFTVGGGLEVGYWPVRGRTFVGRIGFRNVPEGDASPVTFGGSFWGDNLVLEYAFQPVDDESGLHRLTVGWR